MSNLTNKAETNKIFIRMAEFLTKVFVILNIAIEATGSYLENYIAFKLKHLYPTSTGYFFHFIIDQSIILNPFQ